MVKLKWVFSILTFMAFCYPAGLNAGILSEKHFNNQNECNFYDYEGKIYVINNSSICTTDPTSCIEVEWPKGMVGGNSPGAGFCGIGQRTDVWYQFDFMYKSPFKYHDGQTKMLIVYTGPGDGTGANANAVYGILGGKALYFTQQGPGGFYNKDPNSDTGSWYADQKSTWHVMKIYNKMNSGYNTWDGILKIWIDGRLVMDYNDVMFDQRGASGGAYFETIAPYPLFGGGASESVPYNQYSYYDHLIISTSDTGGSVGGSIKIPNPPSGVTIK